VSTIVALTMGDPLGIGPEICLRAAVHTCGRIVPVIVGSEAVLRRAMAEAPGLCQPKLVPFDACRRRPPRSGSVLFYEVGEADGNSLALLPWGRVHPLAGAAAYQYIRAAHDGCAGGWFDAIATAPINKKALQAAGVQNIDHTTILQALTGASRVWTVFQVDQLRIFFLTRHISLRNVFEHLSVDRVYEGIMGMKSELRKLGWDRPRLAVAALNPHAGEEGLFGHEEQTIIRPAVERAQRAGCRVEGPVPADAVFHLAHKGHYDAVLSLYHDQGHIAAKTLDFERTVSITLGLPYVRTSVDHGTAFDIAGTGQASATSMILAVKAAACYASMTTRRED